MAIEPACFQADLAFTSSHELYHTIMIQVLSTLKRSDINPLPAYFEKYILQVPDIDLYTTLEHSITQVQHLPIATWHALGELAYAPGKWTVKETLQHLIDTERIFTYRAMCFARGDGAEKPSFDEQAYNALAQANRRSLQELIDELVVARQSFIQLYQSLTTEMLHRHGMSFLGPITVLAIGFLIPGHQQHHLHIIEEKYHPLLKS